MKGSSIHTHTGRERETEALVFYNLAGLNAGFDSRSGKDWDS